VATRSPARAAAPHPIVYAAIGASDSVGVGADDPATQSWVAVLATRLPRGSTLHNFGIGGILLGEALQRELPGAVASKPDLVTVWNAVNDLKAPVALTTYTQQLDMLLKTLHTRTHAAVFVGNVPALSLLPAFKSVPAATLNAAVAQWNAAIAAAAARYGATLVDLYTPSLDVVNHPEYVSGDGFHPSTTGYRVEADTFWQAILRHKGHLPLP
jgi:lysophospholipase L1-like esterase